MKNKQQWVHVAITGLLGLLMICTMLFVLSSTGYAGLWSGGAGNCGNFSDAITYAEDGDVIVQMIPSKSSDGAVITKNLRLSGGWMPTVNCDNNGDNQYFTETNDYLVYGFTYHAPYSHTTLTYIDSVLTIEDPESENFPQLDKLVIENFILSATFGADHGGGINGVISDSAELLLDNVWIQDSEAFGNGGGFNLVVDDGSRLIIEDSAFLTNTADNNGGGLYVELRGSSWLTIENSQINNNEALFAGGFEIHLYDDSKLVILNSEISSNETSSTNGDGGGSQLFIHSGEAVFRNSSIKNNQAGSNEGLGGGLYIQMDGGQVTFENSIIKGNSANDGGGLYVESVGNDPATVKLINTIFTNNSPNDYRFSQSGAGALNTMFIDQSLFLPTLLNDTTIEPQPHARITDITMDEEFDYIVDFETYGFTPTLPGVHLHFFFDTVAPEDAGVPAPSSNWILYGGPSPFTQYNFTQRPFGPYGAEKMCVLVANPDHSVQLETGNCVKLP